MLRDIKIWKDNKIIFEKVFGKALSKEQLTSIWKLIVKEISNPIIDEKDILIRYFWKYQLFICCDVTKRLIFVFTTDLNDSKLYVMKELTDFVNTFQNKICANDANKEKSTNFVASFLSSVDHVYSRLWPKISLLGPTNVGKTTICRLILQDQLPSKHIPTISGEIFSVIDNESGGFFRLWDYAGQEMYRGLWKKFLEASDLVLIVTDSTKNVCLESAKMVSMVKKQEPDAIVAVIANKQDVPGALPIAEIKKIFGGLEVVPFVAIDKKNRNAILTLITTLTEMNPKAFELPAVTVDESELGNACSLDELDASPEQENALGEQQSASGVQQSEFNPLKVPKPLQKVEKWIFESRDLVKWILEKANTTGVNAIPNMSQEKLEILPDCPIHGGEFDLVWSLLINSPYIDMKDAHLNITKQGRDLLTLLSNNANQQK